MIVCLLYNPLSLAVSTQTALSVNATQTMSSSHRTLPFNEYQNTYQNPENYERNVTKTLILWFVNIVVICGILTKLLVHGEPVIDKTLPSWKIFVEANEQATQAISACNYREAQRQLADTLHVRLNFMIKRTYTKISIVFYRVVRILKIWTIANERK